ncbi:hypothetical protein RHSIM_Rhsim03G0197400 [Rhododendron simsii]|uniref:Hexosyltransferase n=1 Tax=Rhododendron simsii TaxID=118357 RepID=A0A834H770_RHOSS|nr:hypothetical protein RHSIM_Rhsim03G0197400 [Rhododendron simsii]
MQSKGSNSRLSGTMYTSRISTLMLSMLATIASFYVAGRLWQDAENRVYIIKELDRITGQVMKQRLFLSFFSVDDVEKIMSQCTGKACLSGQGMSTIYSNTSDDCQVIVDVRFKMGYIDVVFEVGYSALIRGQSAISVDDTLKIIACREQQKKLSALEMELAAAKPEDFKLNHLAVTNQPPKKRPLVVIGVLTEFGRKTNRDAIRKAWMGTGPALKKMEDRKGIIVRFVIGRSSNRGDSLERAIDSENKQTNDFIILENHVEALEELPKKTKNFFAQASEKWDAEFFAKVNDDVYVNIDALGSTLAAHLDKPRAYIGCMKSGEVFSEQSHKWYEPDWWKFGNKKTYFRHASGEMFVISQALAKFVSINRSILRTYAHDDVSVGSWFIGLDVKHVDEKTFCCSSSSWSSGLSLSLSLSLSGFPTPHLEESIVCMMNDTRIEPSAQVYDHTTNHEKNNSNNKFQKYLKDAIT